jgi:putative phosphoserine phosphatase / 1-acylglycerol-3-phosphate O-acyltransferase
MITSNIGAFFDFDETLLDTESSRLGFKYLWERRLVSLGFILKVSLAHYCYKRHWLSDEKVALLLLKFYRNKRLADFQQGAADFYRRHLKPHLAPNILARAKKHLQDGHILVLISGSVRYLLEPVVRDLGFNHLICTDLEVGPDGLLTGKAKGPLCLDLTKRVLAEKLAKDININLESSFAYGNHQSDLPLLKLVGNPRVVEPTEPLRKVALANQWPILNYR